ncbi:hypothetical protein [Burkholderia sp. AU18528]|uniref:hypothetical protein n=1 Tax=Burkholderia sp. AU18528 TaxID=2015350 RepID=UPI0011800489|nr:hypothetical protein [Burkholderia sp. AU18528]
MKIIRTLLAVVMFSTSFFAWADDVLRTFAPSPGIMAVVRIKGQNLFWSLSGKSGVKQGEIFIDSEKPLSIKIGNYDFSGRLGFWVSHADDGMGTYEVDRVFTSSPSSNEFVERFPSCGDEFANLRMGEKRRYLVSTYWSRNVPKRCIARLSVER